MTQEGILSSPRANGLATSRMRSLSLPKKAANVAARMLAEIRAAPVHLSLDRSMHGALQEPVRTRLHMPLVVDGD